MNHSELLKDWLQTNSIQYEFLHENVVEINQESYLLLTHKRNKIFDENTVVIVSEDELGLMDIFKPNYFITLFGDKFYYFGEEELQTKEIHDEFGDVEGEELRVKTIHELRYVGECEEQMNFPLLGVHGGYDICNGSRSYKDWAKKAKWLGIPTLGLCEENTLAGTLLFQDACKKNSIKSIIGETIAMQYDSSLQYHIKLYCINDIGWRNLLQLNAYVNMSKLKSLTMDQLTNHTEGLVCVLTPTISLTQIYNKKFSEVFDKFDKLFYQLDFVEWTNSVKEEEWIKNLTEYFKKFRDKIEPIALYDMYYLEQQDHEIQPILWRIGKRDSFKYRSQDRYFKTCNQFIEQAIILFNEKDDGILQQAIDNLEFFNDINFIIPTGNKYLPQYELTEEQSKEFADSEELFWDLIQKGLDEKVIDKDLDVEVYIARIQEEVRVIELGQVRDYFLIVWDILNFCRRNEILVGTGRGSAAGCLVSYLLGIVQIDPIHYDLLFERFLNEGRVGKSLPDIDNDIQGSRREEVKRYIEQRYGVDYVAGIGTYGTFKVRAAMKDLVREIGGDAKEANYISSAIDAEDKFFDVIKKSIDKSANPRLKQFIRKHAYQLNHIPQLFQQPKTQSVHAAGIIIVPKGNGPIYQQLPVKKMDDVVMTEWEGSQIEDAGFLKVDVLGLKQLDKFDEIIRLIKVNRGETIELNSIPLDEKGVYHFFQNGFNEDVFQFGGGGLKGYCKELKPDNIEDLIATVALYRPGPIETGAHDKYAKIKNGELEPEYYFGLKEITERTYSQIVYQEQIMRIVQELGGFTLVEADDIRKAMGKKLIDVMVKYKQQFIAGAVERGCPSEEADRLWKDMEGFAGYAFNRSHAACYGITGYYSQWLKYTYPLEFWLTSLKYSDDKEMPMRISEIKHIAEGISMEGPNILKSKNDFVGDVETNTIYWSLSSIKQVGVIALEEIQRLRETYFFVNFEDFLHMIDKDRDIKKQTLKVGERLRSTINRRVIIHLIIAGAFDSLEELKRPAERWDLLSQYFCHLYPELKTDILHLDEAMWIKRMGDYFDFSTYEDYAWTLKQKELCGYGNIDFQELLTSLGYKNRTIFKTNSEVRDVAKQAEKVIVGGIVDQIVVRSSKNGPFVQILIQDGVTPLYLTIWNDVYSRFEDLIEKSKGKLLFIDGEVVFDNYKKANVLHSKGYSLIEILQ